MIKCLKMEEKMKELGAYWDKIEKQHSKGKLFVYERLNLIYDNGEYKELIPENEQDGVVVCEGKISGKSVIVAAQDFTYKGGSLGLRHVLLFLLMIQGVREYKKELIHWQDLGIFFIEMSKHQGLYLRFL